MKDLILIGAYCPDDNREKFLNDCIDSLQKFRKDFDLLVVSHTKIPEYILKKIDFYFYDKDNDLITDMEYMNQPWFRPFEGHTILSTYVANYSTYLSVYRLLIAGLGIAQIYGYKKVHYIEYDSVINNPSDLYDNSELLNEYHNVLIIKEQRSFEDNLDAPMGFFMSMNLENLDEIFLKFDRENLLKILKESRNKTNEKITYKILEKNNRKTYYKNYYEVKNGENLYELSKLLENCESHSWFVPYYNSEKDSINVIGWNNHSDLPISGQFIINDNKIINMEKLPRYNFRIEEIGKIEDISSITILVEGKFKNRIIFDEITKSKFTSTNYSYNEKTTLL